MSKKISWVIVCILAVAGLDQITKKFVVQYIREGQIIPVIDGFFNLTLSYNRGAAFGFLAGIENDTLRIGLLWSATLLAVVAVLYMFIKEYQDDPVGQWALAMILGGALGNVVDRALMGEVVDFLDFYLGTYHWPAFNIADSAICIGVAVLLFRRGSSSEESKETLADSVVTGDDNSKPEQISSDAASKAVAGC